MNKQELKSLLENIYEAMILPTLGQELYANPDRLNPSPLSPTAPVRGPYDPSRDPNWNPPNLGDGWYWRYENGYWVPYSRPTFIPDPIYTDPTMEDWEAEERFRDLLRELGIADEIP